MKTSYDQATDSLYIHLADHASIDSVELTDRLVVDYDLDGVAVGIDMQRVSQTAGVKGVKCTYRENDGTLHIRLTDKAISRETSHSPRVRALRGKIFLTFSWLHLLKG